MKKIFIFFSFILTGLLFNSCSTDFDIEAPYKETMVIYGLLNPDTANGNMNRVQYIRISKAYLGEGNALIMAQESDSINYADILDVKLERIDVNGNSTFPCLIQRVDTNVKEEGIFHNPHEIVYKISNSANGNLNPIRMDGSSYRLTVHNNKTGITATSLTKVIGNLQTENPSTSATFNFTVPLLRTFNFFAAENAWVYNLTIRFHYKEVTLSSNDTALKFVDWNLGDQAIGSSLTTISYDGIYLPDLYRIVGAYVVPVDTNQVKRFFGSPTIEFIYTAGTEDLYTYQQIVHPSEGIVQERPLFTNIENGLGLFTSRYTKSIFKNLNLVSIAAFDTSDYTQNIYFH